MYVNKVTLLGNLGNDPETIISKDNSTFFVTFALTTNRAMSEKAEWHNIVIFSEKLAKFAESSLRKGDQIYIEGGLRYEKYQNKKGDTAYSTKIVVTSVQPTLVKLNNLNNDLALKQSNLSNGGMQ